MASSKATTPAPETPTEPFVVPDDIQLEHKFGAVTGKPMWRVVNFNMPYAGSPEEAVRLYRTLFTAFTTGYFRSNPNRKPAS
jgi:hypothetical protein